MVKKIVAIVSDYGIMTPSSTQDGYSQQLCHLVVKKFKGGCIRLLCMRVNIKKFIGVIDDFLIRYTMRPTKVHHEYYANHLVGQTTHSNTTFLI